MLAGSAPEVGLRLPSRPSSPKKREDSIISSFQFLSHERIAMAIGRSKEEPLFRRFVGARFTVTRFAGKVNPEFFRADLTLSRDSWTLASGSPTIEKCGSPAAISHSTPMFFASLPKKATLLTECIIKGKNGCPIFSSVQKIKAHEKTGALFERKYIRKNTFVKSKIFAHTQLYGTITTVFVIFLFYEVFPLSFYRVSRKRNLGRWNFMSY